VSYEFHGDETSPLFFSSKSGKDEVNEASLAAQWEDFM
jgi:hypothetical protein